MLIITVEVRWSAIIRPDALMREGYTARCKRVFLSLSRCALDIAKKAPSNFTVFRLHVHLVICPSRQPAVPSKEDHKFAQSHAGVLVASGIFGTRDRVAFLQQIPMCWRLFAEILSHKHFRHSTTKPVQSINHISAHPSCAII